jgi:broad specificity phosphatase PhoE
VTTLLLARHGETDWNRQLRFQGHADPPLNDRGRVQARALARALADEPLHAIYASDLRRARETAEIVAAETDLPVVAEPELREVDVGSWSGLTREEIEIRFPAGFARWRSGEVGHDGETRDELTTRVRSAVERIVRRHPHGRVLVVSHGGPLRVILRMVGSTHADGPVLGNCEIAAVSIDPLD